MNELFMTALSVGAIDVFSRYPVEFLDPGDEKKFYDWVKSYYTKYKTLPPISRVLIEFPLSAQIAISTEPIAAVWDRFVGQKKREVLARIMSEQAMRLALGQDYDFAEADRMHRLAKGQDDKTIISSDFDVSWYDTTTVNAIPFVLEKIDEKLGGIKAGQFGVIAGRPGIGKTTLLLYNVFHWWELDMNIFFVSREMTAKELMARFAGMAGGFNYKNLDQSWMIDPSTKQKLKTATYRLRNSRGKIIVPPNTIATPDDIWTHVREKSGFYHAIAIDGLYLMRANNASGQSANWERVANISNSLKQIAIDLNLPILAVTQLKRRGHEDLSPVDLEDLAYADTIGQDADFVIGLSQGDMKKAADDTTVVDASLIKNRSGGSKAKLKYTVDFKTSLLVEETT